MRAPSNSLRKSGDKLHLHFLLQERMDPPLSATPQQATTLQMHCTQNPKQIFPEMKLRGFVPNFYIHVSVSDLCIPTIGPQTQYSKIGGPIVGIYKLLTDT